jgi:hypothetical protein
MNANKNDMDDDVKSMDAFIGAYLRLFADCFSCCAAGSDTDA